MPGSDPSVLSNAERAFFLALNELNVRFMLDAFAKELVHSRQIDVDGVTVRVLELERIIVSKRASNRAKDLAALPALELALKVLSKT